MDVFPADVEWSTLLVVSDLARARAFYCDVLGMTLDREYGDSTLVLRFGSGWLLVVTGAGPTEDKPDTEFCPPGDPVRIDHEIVIKVPDCREAYEVLKSRGARFLTPPHEYEWEVRAFFRDPAGHLFEISQTKS